MIERESGAISDSVEYRSSNEIYSNHTIWNINILVDDSSVAEDKAAIILQFLNKKKLNPLFSIIFAPVNIAARNVFGLFCSKIESSIPSMTISTESTGFTSLQIICISGLATEDLTVEIPASAKIYNAWGARFLYLANIRPDIRIMNRGEQVSSLFRKVKIEIEKSGLLFPDIKRTWIFADRITDWYIQLNEARSVFFSGLQLARESIPASTGIGSGNIQGKDILLSAFAISQSESVKAEKAESPLQCEAIEYSSSFSRVVKIVTPESVKLIISGTASIDKEGNTMFKGNVKLQIERTMEVIGAILKKSDMSFSNMVRSIAYFPDISARNLFLESCVKYELDYNSVLLVQGIICREDLLFELEMDAVKPIKTGN